MKKIVKGFTLIECIVALAILGIASLTMAQIYAGVASRNRNNHLLNTSLSNQMAYVEQYEGLEALPVYYGNATTDVADPHATGDKVPPHKTSDSVANKNYITIVKLKADGTQDVDQSYSYPVDLYVLYSRDANVNSTDPSYKGQAEDNYNLRYKYIIGHSN